MKTATVTYLKEHANSLDLDAPLLVTQNGKAKYVVQDAREYQEQIETLALLKLINLSERSLKIDGEISLAEAFDE